MHFLIVVGRIVCVGVAVLEEKEMRRQFQPPTRKGQKTTERREKRCDGIGTRRRELDAFTAPESRWMQSGPESERVREVQYKT